MMEPSTSTFCAAVFPHAISLFGSLCSFHLYFPPEGFMRDSGSRTKAFTGGVQDVLQLRRVGHEQAFHVFFIARPQQDRYRLTIPSYDHWPLLAGLQIKAKVSLHLCSGSNLHSCTSSPPMVKRFPFFTPIAWIWTSRCS